MNSTAEPKPVKARSGSFAALVAAGIFLSRISGLVREKVFAHFLGNSDAAGVFKAAFRIPNILQNLFGEGVLSASFIPVYAKLLSEHDEKTAGKLAGAVASVLALAVAVVVLLGVLFTPAVLWLIAPGFEGEVRLLAIRIVRILFPAIGILVLSAWCLGILNSHRKFFLSYVAPVFMNIVMIVTLFLFGGRVTDRSLAVAAAWGTVVGAAAQLLVQLPFVFRHERSLQFAIDMLFTPLRDVIRNFVPVVISRGVVQLSAYLDNLIATLLGTAAVAAISYAQIIYTLPVSLFGVSVSAAELPEMARATGSVDEVSAALRARLARGLRQIAFFVIPSSVAFLTIGNLLVAALYQGGRFTSADTIFVWYILIGSTVGLAAATFGRLYSSAFYALRDTRTPLKFAVIRVIVTGVLGYLFASPFRPFFLHVLVATGMPMPMIPGGTAPFGAIALTATAGVAGWLEFVMLRHALQKRIGRIESSAAYTTKLWTCALIAGVSAGAFHVYARPRIPLPQVFPHIRDGILAAGVFGVMYFAMAALMRIEEVHGVLRRLRRR
ncbi:MAG: murein biosynthesis integral membrane protein MurJ [Thermoanaerobaculia bacterium]